jgi:two-component system, sporulation sensor kinase E
MRTAFVDKLIQRMDRLEPQEVQHLMLDLLREKGFLEKVFSGAPGGHHPAGCGRLRDVHQSGSL